VDHFTFYVLCEVLKEGRKGERKEGRKGGQEEG
jgi:hypothetical protein